MIKVHQFNVIFCPIDCILCHFTCCKWNPTKFLKSDAFSVVLEIRYQKCYILNYVTYFCVKCEAPTNNILSFKFRDCFVDTIVTENLLYLDICQFSQSRYLYIFLHLELFYFDIKKCQLKKGIFKWPELKEARNDTYFYSLSFLLKCCFLIIQFY